jgi:hypothetical protein
VVEPRILEAIDRGARATACGTSVTTGESAEAAEVTAIVASDVYASSAVDPGTEQEISNALFPVVTPVGIVRFT